MNGDMAVAVLVVLALFAALTPVALGWKTRWDRVLYAFIFILVAIIVIGTVIMLGPVIEEPFSTINKSLNRV